MAASDKLPLCLTRGNTFFVSDQQGNGSEPAMVFANVQELSKALHELNEGLPENDKLRQSLLPASKEAADQVQCQILDLMLKGTGKCLMWLDRSKNPRIENLGDRTPLEFHSRGGFFPWILRNAGIEPPPPYIEAMHILHRNAAGLSTAETSLSSSSSTTTTKSLAQQQPAVNASVKTASEQEPTETAPVEDTETTKQSLVPPKQVVRRRSESPVQNNLLPNIATTVVETPMVVHKEATAETDQDVEMDDAEEEESNDGHNTTKGYKPRVTRKKKEESPWVSLTPQKERPRRNMTSTPPTVNDEEPFRYVSDKDATRVLRKFEFLVDKKKQQFGRPDGTAVFPTLQELRRHLRVYGAPEFANADDEDKILIGRWIRQSLLRSGDYSGGLPEGYTEFDSMKDMMKLAGFKYQRKNTLYIYPHVTDSNPNILMDGVFDSEGDMIKSLARNGLPDYLYDSLPKEVILGLEVYVDTWAYEKNKRNIFVRDVTSTESARKRTRRSADSPGTPHESSASVSPKKLKASPKNMSSKKLSKQSKSSTSKGKSKSSRKSARLGDDPSFQTPEKFKKKGEEDTSTPTTAATAMTTSATVDVLPWPPAMEPTKTIEGSTDREVLSNVISSLKETVNAPVFSEESPLGKKLKNVQNMIHSVLRSNGRHGGPLPSGDPNCKALYVCGVPGTGKTLSISWLCEYMLHLHNTGSIGVEYDDDDEDVMWKFLIQNANSVASPSSFLANMAKKLGLKHPIHIETRLKKTGMILVVDEMDAMLQSSEYKNLLQKLVEYANDPKSRFTLIGISNSLMDEKFARIQEMGQFRDPMTFSAYGENEIKAILRHRVGSGIFEDNALKMIALKCMGERGDARFALDIACASAKNCLDKIAEDDESLSKGSLIKVKDVVFTTRSQSVDLADRIRGLPQSCKLCLVTLNALAQKDVSTASVKRLRNFVAQCTSSEDEMLTPDDFKHCLETLRDSGLLRMEPPSTRSTYPMQNLMESTVELGYQLEDVQAGLAKVCTGKYYEEVAKLAKQNKTLIAVS